MTDGLKKRDARLSALKVIVGELQRLSNKEPTDGEVIAILKKLVKNDEDLQVHKEKPDYTFRDVVKEFIPKQVTKEEIRIWINAHVDFSEYKNKMQAVGFIKKHFGEHADGKIISEIVKEY